MTPSRRTALRLCVALAASTAISAFAQSGPYFPPAGTWAKKSPAELGMDAAKLAEAVSYAQQHETERPLDLSDQERVFGSLLGSMPTRRAKTNGVVIYKGYVVAEFGDTAAVDPTYSVAKSMLATVTGVALRDGRIASLDQPVGATVKDGGYESPSNAVVTWKMHLQQESEWEGTMWGKKDDFIGKEAFGSGERKPRTLKQPGEFYEYNDVRINRFALSLLRVMDKSVPDAFQQEVMDPIGASSSWKWVPYANSYVEQGGKRMPSVSGGTRWGGGMWINSWDMARFGYLWLRGGQWGGKQLLQPAYVKAALTPSGHGPDYGYLWWLNTKGKNLPGLPTNAFAALGAGSNTITVSPDHDLVVVWRWHSGNSGEFAKRVIAAIK
ncbi:serine hydrolase domain-containing protein [Massilia cavernae]|uniref:Class C beta-lactamase-related serine hydrolase n=1 Tax=Massilia cavernae TaxID=2320864 RepID=A0A418XG06_9BURK|nr:serine hydrolase [Massilia cavernae]RJG11391.1 class C beta-lactamase-related serine hydrolase [Massilia cavernae]